MADRWRADLRPLPIDATIDRLRQVANLGFIGIWLVEVGLTEERAGEEQRRIDGREFRVAETLAGLHVEKMVEKTLVPCRAMEGGVLRGGTEKPQRCEHALRRLVTLDVTPLHPDRIGGQREPDCSDAGERLSRVTIRDEAILSIRGVPEEAEGA